MPGGETRRGNRGIIDRVDGYNARNPPRLGGIGATPGESLVRGWGGMDSIQKVITIAIPFALLGGVAAADDSFGLGQNDPVKALNMKGLFAPGGFNNLKSPAEYPGRDYLTAAYRNGAKGGPWAKELSIPVYPPPTNRSHTPEFQDPKIEIKELTTEEYYNVRFDQMEDKIGQLGLNRVTSDELFKKYPAAVLVDPEGKQKYASLCSLIDLSMGNTFDPKTNWIENLYMGEKPLIPGDDATVYLLGGVPHLARGYRFED